MKPSDQPHGEAPCTDHTFVLRIRRDPSAALPLRATIRDLASGIELSTADLTEVDDFVRIRVDSEPEI